MGQQFVPFLVSIVLMFAVFYFIIIMPDNKRRKKYEAMVNAVKINDQVVTNGGIMGRVVNVHDKYIIIESGPDKSRFMLAKHGIAKIVEQGEESTENKKEIEKPQETKSEK